MPLAEKVKKRSKLAEMFSNKPDSPYYKPGSWRFPKPNEEDIDLLAAPTTRSRGSVAPDFKAIAPLAKDEDEETKMKKDKTKKKGLIEREYASAK